VKPIFRQYKHGGWHPFKKEEGPKPVLKMSEREPSYGTVSQQLSDAVQYSGGDNSDILKMLALTKEKPVTSWGDVNFSSEEILPQFRAARDGDSDNINFFKLDPESQKYVRSKMGGGDLSEMFGRELKPSEERYVRGQVFKNPALLSYFMGVGEEPSRREMKKIRTTKLRGGGSSGGSTTTGGAGSRSLDKAQGKVGFFNKIADFIERCKRDPSCR
jgi:hypothetical protein|tara:strand:- start:44 stop:691 length:648 start_codon:yes stop_codon:yes gene_type:complete